MIFEGNTDDSMAAADALIDHGLLRAKRRERDLDETQLAGGRRKRIATVRVPKCICGPDAGQIRLASMRARRSCPVCRTLYQIVP
jgi:hypothetical protein